MKTSDLIAGLAEHTETATAGLAWRRLGVAVVLATIAALLMLRFGWGMRPDLHEAMRTSAFWMKAITSSSLLPRIMA